MATIKIKRKTDNNTAGSLTHGELGITQDYLWYGDDNNASIRVARYSELSSYLRSDADDTMTKTLTFTTDAIPIQMQENHFINRRFEIDPSGSETLIYVILCSNLASNDVNGRITMDRTSGLRHACQADIIVSAGNVLLPVGSIMSHGVTGSSTPSYRLVTLTYSALSYVALEITSPDGYYETSGAYFTGRIVNSGSNTFTVLIPADVSAVTLMSGGSHQINGSEIALDSDIPTNNTQLTNGAGYVTSSGVTSVAMSVPTGLTIGGTPITSTGTLALSLTSGYSIPTTAKQGQWDTAYSLRSQWTGTSTNLVAATGRTSLGGTTSGQAVFTMASINGLGENGFYRVNYVDDSVSVLTASGMRTAIGAGTSSLALGTGSTNAYRGDYGNTAYAHAGNTSTAVHGATTLGYNLLKITNPGAITFPRFNAGNTVSSLNASDFRTAIGAGTSSLALGTGSTNAYRGDYGNTAYAHAGNTSTAVHGATTLGYNLLKITNPGAITFPRFNANNTVTSLSASNFRTAIGAGTGSGTVTSVGTTGTIAGLTLTGTVTGSGTLTLGGALVAGSSTVRGGAKYTYSAGILTIDVT